jgi:uncharacterized OB-fold protein
MSENGSKSSISGNQEADALLKTLQAYEGTSDGAPGSCPYPVNEPMIHHWCDAMGDRNPAYLDSDFAKSTDRGGIIAPPVMLQAWTMRGLRPSTPEEEAFAAAAGDRKSVLKVLDEAGFTSVVATNCEQEYLRELVPGDQLTHTVEVESVSPEKKTGLGVGHFVTQLYKFMDAQGEVVGTMRFRILKFRPPSFSETSDAGKEPTASLSGKTGEVESAPVIGPRIEGGRPRPSLNQDVSFFWEGAAKGKLLVQGCTECKALRHPPGPGCPQCSSMEWSPVEMSGRGQIYSFVRHHYPRIPPFEAGHPVILVQLDEGPRLISELADHDPEVDAEIEIGMRVEVQFDELEDRLTLPRFRLAER